MLARRGRWGPEATHSLRAAVTLASCLASRSSRCSRSSPRAAPRRGDPAALTDTTATSSTGTEDVTPTTEQADAGEDSTGTNASTTGTGGLACDDPALCPAVCDTISQGCPEGQKCSGVKPGLHDPFHGTACVPDNAGQGAPASASHASITATASPRPTAPRPRPCPVAPARAAAPPTATSPPRSARSPARTASPSTPPARRPRASKTLACAPPRADHGP